MKPLTKKTRLKLIIASIFVFVIVTPFILASSFGYKISSLGDVFTLVKTGGIYLHSDISNASIFIDDEYFKDNGRLLRNTLIQDLMPNEEYEIVIIKEGLHDWRKKLNVDPSLVTEATVLMLPLEIESREIYPFFDKEGNGTTTTPTTLSINTLVGKIIPDNQEYIDLMNILTEEDFYGLNPIEKVEVSPADDTLATSTSPEPIDDITKYFLSIGIEDRDELENLRQVGDQFAWIDNGNVRVNWVGGEKLPNYYFCIRIDECRDEIILDWTDDVLEFEFMPGREEILIVKTFDGVYAVEIDDRSDRNIQPVYSGEELELGISPNNKIVVKDGEVFHELDL